MGLERGRDGVAEAAGAWIVGHASSPGAPAIRYYVSGIDR